MSAHVANATRVAQWLADDPRVEYVRWAGLPSHPHHQRAATYLPDGPGSVFAFGVRGGRDAGARFINSVRLASHLANIGDVRTLVIHPASTTHRQLTDAQLRAAGVEPELVRISVGIEDVDDILWDLDQALTAATKND
jgi:O-acetylhomoserine (thiol)-lyase